MDMEMNPDLKTPCESEPVSQTGFVDGPYFVPNFKPKKKKSGVKKFFKVLICTILICALVVACCGATAIYMDRLWEQKTEKYYLSVNNSVASLRNDMENGSGNKPNVTEKPDENGLYTPAQVYDQNVNAVVAIANQGITTNIFGQATETASSGTGFIISEDGYIVSNYHVISGATKLTVMLPNGQEYEATVVGYDESNDISVLKVEAEGLPCVKFGSSDSLVVGDLVAAIGNPLGELTSTLTVGYISAIDRRVNTDGTSMSMLQTDAAINSGNSGGPLFNMKGEVIGITTAKYSGTSNSGATIEGIGFAIPAGDVMDLIEDLRTFGFVKSGFLGVTVKDVAQVDADTYGIPLGALVIDVAEESCAHTAGIMKKDIIVDVGGHKITSIADLTRALRKFEGGEETVVTVYRGGAEKTIPVTLEAKPQN